MIPILVPILAAASFDTVVSKFLDFAMVVTILLGIPKIAQGAWNISRGNYNEGIAAVIGGFLCCLSVPIIRTFAGWLGLSI